MAIKQIVFLAIYPFFYPILTLSLAGDWFWLEGWLWAASIMVSTYTTCIYLARKDPALLQERFHKHNTKNQKGWDKILL